MRIGFHVSKKSVVGGGKSRKIRDAIPEDMQLMTTRGLAHIAQIFVCGPQRAVETLEEMDKEWLAAHPEYPTVVHGAYIDHPWSEQQRALDNLKLELTIARRIGATGVIVHLASGAHEEETFHRVIAKCLADTDGVDPRPILWLETQAAKSTPWTYETPEKMTELCRRVAPYAGRVGICIDTAHLFVCGASLTTAEDAKELFDVLDNYKQIPVMIHLNDSASTQGSGKDKHEGLCVGKIWQVYAVGGLPVSESGLAYIIKWAVARACDVILERGYDPSGDLEIILGLLEN